MAAPKEKPPMTPKEIFDSNIQMLDVLLSHKGANEQDAEDLEARLQRIRTVNVNASLATNALEMKTAVQDLIGEQNETPVLFALENICLLMQGCEAALVLFAEKAT